jgi:guanosine-3',5'-bis(diphosphate) 3'-pyrophosphohydrolase
VLKAAFPDYRDERVAARNSDVKRVEEGWYSFSGQTGMKFRHLGDGEAERMLPLRTVAADHPVRFAPNGGAVPGDRIVGIVTPGEGITIYPIQSPALKAFDDQPALWLDVRWDIDANDPLRFPAQIMIHSFNEPGSLAKIAQTISDNDGNIDNIRMARRTSDFHDVIIDLEVWDLKHLNRIINQLRTRPNVSRVERVNG